VRVEWQNSPDEKQSVVPKTPRSRRTLPLPGEVAEALAAHMAAYQTADDGSLGLPAGTTSHHLRHHYASVLLAAGESVVAVAGRLGHENGTLVLKTYGHLMPDMEDRTRPRHRRRVDR
jgi:integrase